MNSTPFLVSEERLERLRATRQGRISLGGFNYQAGFAIARMAAMLMRSRVLDIDGVPTDLRYDWGEDLDERWADGTVCFTQCKKVADIGQPHALARVLSGFAPKLLWAATEDRAKVRFRLVCTDARFSTGGALGDVLADAGDEVKRQLIAQLSATPAQQSDAMIWRDAAADFGHAALADALWSRTEAIFLPERVYDDHPAGTVLHAEREALRLLAEKPAAGIDAGRQREAIERLRSVLHENLIAFAPASDESLDLAGRTPRLVRREDVASALFELRRHDGKRLPFQVVSPAFLREQQAREKREFVARPPEWADVVHGTDAIIKFVERDQTAQLREAVLRDLVEPLRHGTAQRLAVKFVLGSPGSGKSTLARRVVAELVQEGRIVAADPGLYLDNCDDIERFCDKLDELVRQGKPVLLLLDDPLYAESTWPTLLKRLSSPVSRVSVLAASPTFLNRQYRSQLRGRIQASELSIAPPSDRERRVLDRLYGYRPAPVDRADDDFLVLAMQRAAGISFDEIIHRLWETLNGGRPISDDTPFDEYPWALRAFLVTCFFHRTSLPCPEPILRAVLEQTGGTTSGRPIVDALGQMTHQQGWAIFRIKAPDVHPSFAFVGNQVSAVHQQIAERAWSLRPAPWRSMSRLIVQAAVDEPGSIKAVGTLAGLLDHNGESELADELGETFTKEDIATRDLYNLVAALSLSGCSRIAKMLSSRLRARATATPDGWLAALRLWYSSASAHRERAFPPDLDLASLIDAGDFSIAPRRAIKFAAALKRLEQNKLRERFLQSLNHELSWELDSALLTWLIANQPIDRATGLIQEVADWLEEHPDDTSVRTQYLSYLMRLEGAAFDDQRRQAAEDTVTWLAAHPDDTFVRTQYLAYLMKLAGTAFDEERKQAAKAVADWLKDHPDVTDVRTQYLAYLMKLEGMAFDEQRRQAVEDTARWLVGHPDDTAVRTQYLSYLMKLPGRAFDDEREQAAKAVADWLKDHADVTDVRTQYLAFLMKLEGTAFDEQRRQAAEDTSCWVDQHPDATDVRTQFLSFLMKLPAHGFEEMRRSALESTTQWLYGNPKANDVRTIHAAFSMQVVSVDSPAWADVGRICLDLVNEIPHFFRAREIYGDYLLKSERFAAAAEEFRAALLLHKGRIRCRLGLAEAHKGLGDDAAAESELKHALWWARHSGQSSAEIHTRLGWLYLEQRRWMPARSEFQAAAAEAPDHFGNHWGIGQAELAQCRHSSAARSLRRALDCPDLPPSTREEIEAMLARCTMRSP